MANFTQLKQFPDLKDKSKWYFYDMVEATNAHEFVISDRNELWQ